MSERHWRVLVFAAAAAYAAIVGAVSIARLEGFIAGHDLAIFGQYLWQLAHLERPFSTITHRAMLDDHFQPSFALLAPLGFGGYGAVALLAVQAIAIAAAAPVLHQIARRRGAAGSIAALPALLWLASPVVVRANLFDFHPDSLVPICLLGAVAALLANRTWLFVILLCFCGGLKEDVGMTIAAVGVVVATSGWRRLGIGVAIAGAIYSTLVIFVVLPQLNRPVRDYYTQLFTGDRADSLGGLATYFIRHPVDSVGAVFSLEQIGILAVIIASTGGLCLVAGRWMLIAAPTATVNVLSAYDPQHTLDYHYWLVPMAACALAGAIGAGNVPQWRWRSWSRQATVVLLLLAMLSLGALRTEIQQVRTVWPDRVVRLKVVDAVHRSDSVSAPGQYLPWLTTVDDLYASPEPILKRSLEDGRLRPARPVEFTDLDVVVVDEKLPGGLAEETLTNLGFALVRREAPSALYRR